MSRPARVRGWREMRESHARLLERRTGETVERWNRRIRAARVPSPDALRAWLAERGVTGYARDLLVMERFGYPDFMLATASALIDAQYSDRSQLRPIFDELVRVAATLGDVTVQARKGFVSLVAPRRTFARVQATTRDRVDLSLRLERTAARGRLKPLRLHEGMPVGIALASAGDVDAETRAWLQRAYAANGAA